MKREETLERIRDAEAEVRDMKVAAERERDRILKAARREALELQDRLRSDAQRHYDNILEEASAAIEGERRVLLERGTKEAAGLRAAADANLDTAVEHLLARFRGALDV